MQILTGLVADQIVLQFLNLSCNLASCHANEQSVVQLTTLSCNLATLHWLKTYQLGLPAQTMTCGSPTNLAGKIHRLATRHQIEQLSIVKPFLHFPTWTLHFATTKSCNLTTKVVTKGSLKRRSIRVIILRKNIDLNWNNMPLLINHHSAEKIAALVKKTCLSARAGRCNKCVSVYEVRRKFIITLIIS